MVNATEREAGWNFGIIEFYQCCTFGCKFCKCKASSDVLDSDAINFSDKDGNNSGVDPEDNDESDYTYALI